MVLPISVFGSRLKKTLLFRTIQSEVSNGSLAETLLEILEIIEEYDRRDGLSITNKMKWAYCAIAVWCTVKYLDDINGLYFDAVKRIWRGSIREMEEAAAAGKRSALFTAELIQWRDLIEAAVGDSKLCERLANVNENDVLIKVRIIWKKPGHSWVLLFSSLPLHYTIDPMGFAT